MLLKPGYVRPEATRSISTPPWVGRYRVVFLPKKTTRCPRPGLEPGPRDREASALNMKAPRILPTHLERPCLCVRQKYISMFCLLAHGARKKEKLSQDYKAKTEGFAY